MTKQQYDKLPLDQQMAFMNKVYKGEAKFDKTEDDFLKGFARDLGIK